MPKQDVVVEFFYSGAWHAVPVYARDPITITRGKQDEGGGPVPQTAAFTLDNRDRRWSTHNPTSPLYGLVGLNTPVRVTLTDFRFWGEVASMTPRRTPDFDPATGRGDAWVEVEAAGPLRRINAGTDPLGSPLRRAMLAAAPTDYWPLEETSDATEATNLVSGRPPLRARTYSQYTDPSGSPRPAAGLPKWATGNGIPGSLPVPDFAQGGGLRAEVIPPAGAKSWRIGFVMVLPRDQAAVGGIVIRWDTTVSTWSRWEMQFDVSGLFLTAQEPASGTAGYSASWTDITFDGQPHYVEVEAFDVSGNLDVRVYLDGLQVDQLGAVNAPNLAGTVGGITRVDINPGDVPADDPLAAGLPQLGHLAIWQPPAGLTDQVVAAVGGHAGETTMARYVRLCGEQGVTAYYSGPDPDDVQRIGVQRAAPFADLLAEIERTEAGIIYETRGGVGLVLATGRSLHGAAPVATLDYSAGQLTTGSDGVLDDQGVRNEVTAKSPTGAEATRTLDAGPLSTAPPPAGIGRYATPIDVNPANVGYLGSYARRALAAGTVRGLRWPRLVVDVASNPSVAAAVCALDPGDRVRVVNIPLDVTPDAVDLVVVGTIETIGTHTRTITIIGRPYVTVDAPVVGAARADSETSTLAAAATSSATTLSVTRAAGSARWTVDPAAFPFDARLDLDGGTGGERVTVTSIAGTGTTQTFTVVRSVNGVVRSWAAGTQVRLWSSPPVGL